MSKQDFKSVSERVARNAAICAAYAAGHKKVDIAEQFGMSQQAIGEIIKRVELSSNPLWCEYYKAAKELKLPRRVADSAFYKIDRYYGVDTIEKFKRSNISYDILIRNKNLLPIGRATIDVIVLAKVNTIMADNKKEAFNDGD